jgi:hypothetical protein
MNDVQKKKKTLSHSRSVFSFPFSSRPVCSLIHRSVSCCRARPQYEIVPFSLMTAFPNKELTDEMATLAELQLLNAVIIQRVTG